jgi:hypothetical protein
LHPRENAALSRRTPKADVTFPPSRDAQAAPTESMIPKRERPRLRGSVESSAPGRLRGNMDKLSLHDPLFATYVIAATLMILKAVGMAWLTVVRMI